MAMETTDEHREKQEKRNKNNHRWTQINTEKNKKR